MDRGDVFEGERRFNFGKPCGHHPPAAVFHNHADAGNYAEAIKLAEETGTTPNVDATRKNGTLKYGFGVNREQEMTTDTGVFMRLGWNDGKTESFAFTAIDRLATGGLSVNGARGIARTIRSPRHSRPAAFRACMRRTWRKAATTS